MREVRNEVLFGNTKVAMPYYTADRALWTRNDPYSLDTVLRKVFSEDYEKSIQSYLKEAPEAICKSINVKDSKDFKLISVGQPKVVSSRTQGLCHTAVDILINATIEASVPLETCLASGLYVITTQRKSYVVQFRLRYILDLVGKKCSAPIAAPADLFPKDEIVEKPSADEYLLPIIHQKDYPAIAREMLKSYYPEALKEPMAIDGFELAKRMKVKVRIVWFEKGSDVLGRVFFEEAWEHYDNGIGQIGYYKVPARTILINKGLCKTPEVINSTIIHECCHLYLDTPFFMVQLMSGKPFQSHISRKRTKERKIGNNSPVEWMELQAEKLPAFVLMEENNTKAEIERLLGMRGRFRTPDNMRWLIKELAKTFKVSLSMAKYRAIELGYPEAEGVFTYLDNTPIPDHGCKGPWQQGITYSISRIEASRMMLDDPDFARAVRSGLYTYTEGHFCLDSEEYLHRDRDGKKRLSVYARWHIDECCMSFYTTGRSTKAVYKIGQAAKHTPVKNSLQTRHGLNAEPESKERIAENKQYGSDAKLWAEIKRTLPDDVKKAIFFVMKKKGLSQEEMGMRLGVTRTAFANWFKGKISLRHIIAICIALDVRVDVSMEFIRLAGHTFLNSDEHALMQSFLFETSNLTVARANEIMREAKQKPLTEGKQEELAAVG